MLADVAVVLVANGAAWQTRKPASRRRPQGLTAVAALAVDEDKAAELAQTLAQMTVSHPSAASWLALGHVRLDAGDHAGAEEAATKALEMNPGHGGAMMLRAHLLLASQHPDNTAPRLQGNP